MTTILQGVKKDHRWQRV